MTTATEEATKTLAESGLTAPSAEDLLGTTTVEVTDERKITWGYSRTKNLGNYESEKVSIYATDVLPESTGLPTYLVQVSGPVFTMLKVEVWSALDLDFSYDSQGQPMLGPGQNVPPPPQPYPNPREPRQVGTGHPPAQQATTPPPPSPRAQAQRAADPPSMAQVGAYAEQPEFCKECGGREFWDNRRDVDARLQAGKTCTPDWVCKNQDCKHGYFRPGSYDYNKAIKQKPNATGPTPTMPPGPPPDEVPFG